HAGHAWARLLPVHDALPILDVAVHQGADIRQITRGLLREDFLIPVAREGGPRQICISVDQDRTLWCTATRVMHGAFPIYLSVAVDRKSTRLNSSHVKSSYAD